MALAPLVRWQMWRRQLPGLHLVLEAICRPVAEDQANRNLLDSFQSWVHWAQECQAWDYRIEAS
jgi:hypothetical protein